ncbi:DNA gyrase subunit A [Rubellimicrobium rubrum]|uniref:DNA gyrase subunit A n=1 Tax=Rubellimicrobium rubrum TaxID=2585369 RepID=A0A5C4N2I6_9RHOB|nr:DNA gyrase subunit A [Rubellimicrobium rubrum]TNC51141.1 DNA gyrase subunit A [Rubellimicrobium rubrum]
MSDTPDTPDETFGATPKGAHGPTISIAEEMKTSYLDYAMSVIVSRAIPDLRDGLKPVQRRILYAMHETGNTHDKSYRKSARPVGDVMGKYHPHGDSSIYEALVRMAQDFSMSLPLLDGQGNFGSMDGDPAAAMRYTEVRMDKPAAYVLADIDKETVDFQDNYDGKDREPTVLPTRFPNMLVNGAGGIAVGMATNIPPHNLGEVVDATLALIDDPDLTSEDLIQYVPGPDFPTGGVMLGRSGARKAYLEGRGSVVIRSKTHMEEIRTRQAIIVTEIPYQVNKATMIDKIAEAARDKRIEGIAHVQDESDRNGVRVVIELKRDATADVVLNQLWRFTPMQTSFGCNMLALNGGKPETLTLRRFLTSFIDFREEVVARRTAFELRKARERAHILCGLAVAVSNVDEVVQTIRSSRDAAEARERLMTRAWPAQEIAPFIRLIDDPLHPINEDGTYNLSDAQARAILDLRLQRLTQLGVEEVTNELQELAGKIKEYLEILGSRERIMGLIADELREVRSLFAVPRRTEITEWAADLEDEDLIEREDMVVTVTQGGWIKRTPLSEFRSQRRGGKGLSSMQTKEEDVVTTLFVANTHTPLLFFTTDGMAYKLKCWRLPLAGRTAKGKALVNLLPIEQGVTIAAIVPVDRPEDHWDELQIVFATSTGDVRRNALSDFTNVNRAGKIAMKLPDGVDLVNARIASEDDDVLLVTDHGRAIRFPTTDVRVFKGRDSTGVRGISLRDETDHVVSMSTVRHFEASPEERGAYLKMRRAVLGVTEEENGGAEEDETVAGAISQERYAEMSAAEDLILTITSGGMGKITSSHDYRVSNRGGMGVLAMDLSERRGRETGRIVAAFPVELSDQIMLVTSGGQSIRVPVDGISFRSRGVGGVRVFDVDGEEVVSVAKVAEQSEDDVPL